MSISRTLSGLVAAGVVAGGLFGSAGPIQAAPTGNTSTTFTVQAGTLDVTVPGTADLGTGDPATSLSSGLGSVTVTDDRAALDASWEVTVVSTDFTTGTATAPETVPASSVSYRSGPATATTGQGPFTPGQSAFDAPAPIDVPLTAFTKSGGTGSNSATWSPTVVVEVPAANVAGAYSGTITHSVA